MNVAGDEDMPGGRAKAVPCMAVHGLVRATNKHPPGQLKSVRCCMFVMLPSNICRAVVCRRMSGLVMQDIWESHDWDVLSMGGSH